MNHKQLSLFRDVANEYVAYQKRHPQSGFIKAQALTAQKTFPVPDVKVEILKQLPSGEYVINTQKTNASGMIQPVKLPTLPKSQSLAPGIQAPFETYDIKLTHPDFTQILVKNVPVYEGLTTLQQIEMIPKDLGPKGIKVIEYNVNAPVV